VENLLSSDRDYRLWVLLCQAKDAIGKARQKELRQYGISCEQATVLFAIQSLGGKATPNEVARQLLRRHHTILGILDRMVKKGLLNKSKGLGRKNLISITLTEKGEKAYHESTRLESVHRIISCLPEENYQQLGLGLQLLRDAALEELGLFQKPKFP
jgi:DNA-binding MarR family transcriptional regulator